MTDYTTRYRLQLLIDLGHEQMVTHDLPLLLDRVLQRVLTFAGHDSGSIMLYDEQLDRLEVCASTGDGAVPVGTQVENMQRSVASHVLRTCAPLVLLGCGENVGTEWRDYTRDIPSAVCLPLLLREGRPIGVLSLKSTYEPRLLVAEDIDTLQLLATHLAGVIEQSRLNLERSRLLSELAQTEGHLRELIGQLLSAQEEERRRVAYDIHDGLAQMAASAYQHLQNVASRYHPRDPQMRQDFDQALDLIHRTVKEARCLIMGLRPAALDDLGLGVALRIEVDQLRASGWQIVFQEDPALGRLPALIETTLFRTAQEALTNIRKHAGTTRVAILVGRSVDTVYLVIHDWGRGYTPTSEQRKYGEQMGVIGMRERVRLLGGSCRIESIPDQGTSVTVEIPLPAGTSPGELYA
ncbi:MAG: hypothetical protein RLZZ387_3403 [Chloroflexota bacterium]|jgi:signal transduction histidine kinase